MQVIEIKIVARGSTVQVYENRLVGLSPVVCSRWPVGCGSINGLGLGAIDGGWRIVKERLCCFGLGPTDSPGRTCFRAGSNRKALFACGGRNFPCSQVSHFRG